MKTALITVVRGRREHLAAQQAAVARIQSGVDDYVVVAMGDPAVRRRLARGPARARVLDIGLTPEGELPLAAARNAGASAAIEHGAELLVFLDVDCVPDPGLFDGYRAAAVDHPDRLLCGPVAYLPPAGPNGYDWSAVGRSAVPHPARPAPPAGTVIAAAPGDRSLFWSLSFAVTVSTWQRIDGFCEFYTGYGGEDTDFAEQAAAVGVGLSWVGGALAFHQYHPVSNPPVEHRDAILRNAALFRSRWGWWPMQGWLAAFAERGLAEYRTDEGWVAASRWEAVG